MRLVIPTVKGRGAGLGNELFPWGKAFVAAQALNCKFVRPAFGLNPRNYHRYFKTNRLDWFLHKAICSAVPHITFTYEEYKMRKPMSFASAVRDFVTSSAERSGSSPILLRVEGMWGGFSAIEPARHYLYSQLMSSAGAADNIFRIENRTSASKLKIGLHIRRGDFAASDKRTDFRGKFNVAIPLDWYFNIAKNIIRHFRGNVEIIVVSDAPSESLRPFGSEIDCIFTDTLSNRDISDLLTLSLCDLIVCSVSSYSLWASFFSHGRYIWFEPNLTEVASHLSIWGHEEMQRCDGSETWHSIHSLNTRNANDECRPRGVPVSWSGQLTDELYRNLEDRLAIKRQATDLLSYGAIPSSYSYAGTHFRSDQDGVVFKNDR